MSAYYNEIDPFAAQWLRNLIAAGRIAPGDVDERSIEDVQASDLEGYAQCHFFAGIGVWSHSLRLAGWPDDRPVWTGSCPCQPFSAAGKRGGFTDARHLWPAWQRLIAERAPSVVFGEQVASKDGYAWLDVVQADLEGLDYACGPVVLPAASLGAPHGRHRIYFVADTGSVAAPLERSGDPRPLDDAASTRRSPAWSRQPDEREGWSGGLELGRPVDILGDTDDAGSQGRRERGDRPDQWATGSPSMAGRLAESSGVRGWWRDADWLWCADQKYRPVEPGTFPLAHGAPARVGRLRAYGNAIVAPVAAAFIEAYLDL